ncbi:hypothetical protein E1287_16630 [Actinomadura sp. KC06]|uniref:hypothetical protein n=1 Tax=Actinomadura sp. KC06 TaxID=2530369 RepID=UPI001042CAFD|nr:hypothetical protein [Actinomadura sp. KC06]TDD34383.1 hypothetical protein E1287_16630 [Actinomadura sp. KC06]
MSDHHQPGSLDRRAAERLLDGAYDHARLHALLAAAAAPGRPEELAGEDAAVAAFTAAPRPESRSRTAALRRFLTVKALAVVGGSLILTGGAAYATITGQLPGRDPAPPPSPSHQERKDTHGDENPATRSSSPAPPATGPSTTSPHGKAKQHGKSSAPGQQRKQTKDPRPHPPRHTPEPPRGPGNDNGNLPTVGGVEPGNNTTTTGGSSGANPPPTTAPRSTGAGRSAGRRN